jgi:hypothetical protein
LGRGGLQLGGGREYSMIVATRRDNLNPQRHSGCESKGHCGRWATRQRPQALWGARAGALAQQRCDTRGGRYQGDAIAQQLV